MPSLIPFPFDTTTDWMFLQWIAQLYCTYTKSMSLLNKSP